jgi:hypothetical protein
VENLSHSASLHAASVVSPHSGTEHLASCVTYLVAVGVCLLLVFYGITVVVYHLYVFKISSAAIFDALNVVI